MMKDIKCDIGPVQQTLLIPLLGRAAETHRGGLIDDPKALELVERLDYDFDKWKGKPSLVGASIRTNLFDEEVSAYLSEFPAGIVVELGCGLNTRYERLDNGEARWFEIDFPDVMELRRQFFEEDERRRMLAADVTDTSWVETVAEAADGPICFVSEAVVIYLEEPDVRALVERLAARFPGSLLLTDTCSTRMVENQARHDSMSKLPKESWFRWKCDDPKSLESWGVKLERSFTFADARPELVDRMPFPFRFAMRWLGWLFRRVAKSYRINRYRLGAPALEPNEQSAR